MRSTLYGITSTSWRGIKDSSIGAPKLDSVLTRFRVQCFSACRAHASSLPKLNLDPPVVQKLNREPRVTKENDAFYVVRKGDVIGIYRSLSDCQAQVSSSICDPSVGVYKGNSLRRETEEYLASQGLKNAIYLLNAVDVRKDMFGTLVPCPFTQPDEDIFQVDESSKEFSSEKTSKTFVNNLQPDKVLSPVEESFEKSAGDKKLAETVNNSQPDEDIFQVDESSKEFSSEKTFVNNLQPDKVLSPVEESFEKSAGDKKLAETVNNSQPDKDPSPVKEFSKKSSGDKNLTEMVNNSMTYILEFDGSSKGNPGKSGAGAVLRREDGTVVCHLREGLGTTTNNVAEYRALIMGMKYALKKGYQQIRVQGDSDLVCRQVNGTWKTKNPKLVELCKEAQGLKTKFQSFKISHVLRKFNSDADAQADIAASLPSGKFSEESLVT